MADEWDKKMADLELFRAANRHRSIAEILSEISEQVVRDKMPSDAPASSPAIPAWCEILPPAPQDDAWPEFDPTPAAAEVRIEPEVVLKTENITVEQLSLF